LAEAENRVHGLLLKMHGLVFWFVLDAKGVGATLAGNAGWYRPWVLDIHGPRRSSRLFLAWSARPYSVSRIDVTIE